MDNFLDQVRAVGILTALAYHIVGGLRHLVMDMGYWEESWNPVIRVPVPSLRSPRFWRYWRGYWYGNSATFGRSGVHDYILIRATALIDVLRPLSGGFVAFNDITYEVWTGFSPTPSPRSFHPADPSYASLIHARIGLWQVLTDHIKSRSDCAVRCSLCWWWCCLSM